MTRSLTCRAADDRGRLRPSSDRMPPVPTRNSVGALRSLRDPAIKVFRHAAPMSGDASWHRRGQPRCTAGGRRVSTSRSGSSEERWSGGAPFVMVLQAADVWYLNDGAAGWRLCSPRDRRIFVQREVRAPLVIQLDNPTPIILSREQSVTRGTRGSGARSSCTKRSSSMDIPSVGVGSRKSGRVEPWRSRHGCLSQPRAVGCA